MTDQPFNPSAWSRMDALYGTLLQCAVDRYGPGVSAELWDCIAPGGREIAVVPLVPPVPGMVIAEVGGLCIVCSQSSVTWYHLILDAVGSPQSIVAPIPDPVATYFGLIAQSRWANLRASIQESIARGNRVVWIGHSLGAAVVTLMRDMALRTGGVQAGTACYLTGCPRPGSAAWAAAYDTTGIYELGNLDDPVPSVPPTPWAVAGWKTGWIPSPPLIEVGHPTAGQTLLPSGETRPGYTLMDVPELSESLALGNGPSWHEIYEYSIGLRRRLPDELTDGFGGYAGASRIDDLARRIYPGKFWPWGPGAGKTALVQSGGPTVTIQVTIGITQTGTEVRAGDEVYYGNYADLAAAELVWQELAPLRRRVMASNMSIYYWRASVVGSSRVSVLRRNGPIIGPGSVSLVTDTPEVSALYSGEVTATGGGQGSRRSFHIRGIPDDWVAQSLLTPAGQKGFENFQGSGFLGRYRATGGVLYARSAVVGGDQSSRILSAAKDGQYGLITITTADAMPWSSGDRIVLSQLPRQPQLRGEWQIANSPANSQYTLRGSERVACPASLTGWATFATTYEAEAMDRTTFLGISTKKMGKKKYLPHGRKSAVLIRR